jgi:pimeloyl-ACP methyl ester carboxylesterase
MPIAPPRALAPLALVLSLFAPALLTSCAGPSAAEREAESSDSPWRPLVPIEEVEFEHHTGLDLEPVEIDGLPGWARAFAIERPDGSRAVIYVSGDADGAFTTRKPLLLWFQGSGAQSVFKRYPQGLSGGLFAYLGAEHSDRFHVVVIEKRGVEFLGGTEHSGNAEGASREFHEHSTWEGRVGDGCLVLDALLEHPMVDRSCVLAVGHSEGGDIAAGLAAVRDEVTHVAVLAGAGGCQWAELVMLLRHDLREEGLTETEIEEEVQKLFASYSAIMEAPDSVDDMFYGHAFRRWSSYGRRTPAESLVDAKAAIYLAQGTTDTAVPIESFDHVVVELLRRGRTDVTVRRYPDADHGFATPDDVEQNGILEALDAAVAWCE